MAETQWYYLSGGQTYGPMTAEHLRRCAAAGYLQPDHHVYCQGMMGWLPARQVPGLFAESGGVAVLTPPTEPLPLLNYAPVAGVPGGYPGYAGFWRRFAAILIDGVMLAVVAGAVRAVMQAYADNDAQRDMLGALSSLVSLVGRWLYFALMECSINQATFGKMALGIRVVDLEGRPVSFGRATGRYFGKIVSALALGIGYILAGFGDRKQALHDMMAGCLVVKKR